MKGAALLRITHPLCLTARPLRPRPSDRMGERIFVLLAAKPKRPFEKSFQRTRSSSTTIRAICPRRPYLRCYPWRVLLPEASL